MIEALGIDLPIVKPRPGNAYPYCNVAMYLSDPRLGQPGADKASYIYAHARDGMFGPIYDRAIQKEHGGPNSMKGMIVQVFTSDDVLHEYQITKVLLDQRTLNTPMAATHDQLWLQTSEGPKGTVGKTQVVAEPLLTLPADHATAHPTRTRSSAADPGSPQIQSTRWRTYAAPTETRTTNAVTSQNRSARRR